MPCPVNRGLPAAPAKIAKLPVDERGFPVPFFVGWEEGKPIFPAADHDKLRRCVQHGLCWVCGEKLGRYRAWVVGPMCLVNLTSSEPPSHSECAKYSVTACPFLTRPNMKRVPRDKIGAVTHDPGGVMIERNPGVTAVILTAVDYQMDRRTGLFHIPEPIGVDWWREGRGATRAEVEHATMTGLPALKALCRDERDHAALARYVADAKTWWPGE